MPAVATADTSVGGSGPKNQQHIGVKGPGLEKEQLKTNDVRKCTSTFAIVPLSDPVQLTTRTLLLARP